jgi:hypothetical protein
MKISLTKAEVQNATRAYLVNLGLIAENADTEINMSSYDDKEFLTLKVKNPEAAKSATVESKTDAATTEDADSDKPINLDDIDF